MTDVCKSDRETTSRKKKRPRLNAVLRNKDDASYSLLEENFAESYMKKLSQKVNQSSFYEVLSIVEEFENDRCDAKKLYEKIEIILKDQEDLQREFLGFLEPYQAYECGKLMLYYEMYNMKHFVCNLMLHFKRQPHLLNKILEKLCSLVEQDNIHPSMIDAAILPFLQKNSTLVQQFLQLLPDGKPPDWCFSSDNSWEDFNIENELTEEETFEISSQMNDASSRESKNCIYCCARNKSSLCPICSVKFINGRMYVANGKILRPAHIIFDLSEQGEQIKRISEKSAYFVPTTSKPRSSRKVDISIKDTNDERLSPVILGTESEEELGDHEPRRRKRKRKSAQRLKVRFDAEKKEAENVINCSLTDDTAPSNEDVSCDEAFKDDNEYNSCDETPLDYPLLESTATSSCVNNLTSKEIVKLGDMELNFSKSSLPWSIKTHSTETGDC